MLNLGPDFDSAARPPQTQTNWLFWWWAFFWLIVAEDDRKQDADRPRRDCTPRPKPPKPPAP